MYFFKVEKFLQFFLEMDTFQNFSALEQVVFYSGLIKRCRDMVVSVVNDPELSDSSRFLYVVLFTEKTAQLLNALCEVFVSI